MGFLKPEHKETFDKYILINKDRSNWKEVLEFCKNIEDEIYLSIDLDILRFDEMSNTFNKYNFLLKIEELLEILRELKEKIRFVDITGFTYLKNRNLRKSINNLKKIIQFLH